MSSSPKPNTQQPNDALAGKLQRAELQRSASSIPGREIVQVRTEIPAGVESGWLSPETGQMLSTYVVEPGQPLATFVEKPPGYPAPPDPDTTRD